VILIGPPGAGKSMLAKRLPTILPPMSLEESLETTKIHSVAGKIGKRVGLITQRPFRKPHHTISDVALVGGGMSITIQNAKQQLKLGKHISKCENIKYPIKHLNVLYTIL